MPTFTADQLQDQANAYNDMAVNTGRVRLNAIHAGQPLNDPGIVNLLGVSLSLANQAASYAEQAANVTLDDVAAAAATIESATAEANAALTTLANVDKAINIGAAGIVLAAAAFTADPKQIAAAAKALIETSIAATKPAAASESSAGSESEAADDA